MDNFALPNFERPDLAEVAAAYAYSQLHESDVPNYRYWAREYALCDNFFASVPGASYPNHLFFVAGHSGGVFDNPGEHADRSVPRRWAMEKLGMRCSRGRLRPQPRGRDHLPPVPSSATRQAIHSSTQERTLLARAVPDGQREVVPIPNRDTVLITRAALFHSRSR
jgi:hypothetical protein